MNLLGIILTQNRNFIKVNLLEGMINRIKDYFENRRIRKLLKTTSEDIFTTFIEFDDLCYKYIKTTSPIDKLLMFCIFTIASDRTADIFENRYNRVLELYYRNVKVAVGSKTFKNVNELQKLKAGVAFSKTQLERIIAFEYYKMDEYLFESLQYRFELNNRGPITPDQLLLIKKASSELEELNKKVEKLEKENANRTTLG